MKTSFAKTTAFLLLAAAVDIAASVSSARADSSIQEYGKALAQYFGSLNSGLEPLIAPEGQHVGDLIDIQTRAVLKRRVACFPNLTPPKPESYELPRFVGLSQTAASFFFKIKNWLGLSASEKFVDRVSLVFTEGTIEVVTLGDLQANLSKDCDFLKPLIEQAQSIKIFGRDATLISAIVRAKTTTIMSFGTDAKAEAKLEELKHLLPGGASSIVPIDASLQAKIDAQGQKVVGLDSGGAAPVSFRPTHIAKRLLGPAPTDGLIVFDAADQVQRDIQKRAIDAWINSLKE